MLEMALTSHCKRPCLETSQETPVAFRGSDTSLSFPDADLDRHSSQVS
jgi:hypothetical protein